MNTIVLLIHDIQFPYLLFEEALWYAKEHECAFRAVFLTNELLEEVEPLQLGTAQQTIAQHGDFLRRRTGAAHIPYEIVLLHSPTLQEIIEHTRGVEKVFVDERDETLFSDWSFSREELLRCLPIHQVMIG